MYHLLVVNLKLYTKFHRQINEKQWKNLYSEAIASNELHQLVEYFAVIQ